MEWKNDPEFSRLRAEFMASFAERARTFESAVQDLKPTELQHAAHKLAGVAESYGFPTLTTASGALDDWLSLAPADATSKPARLGYLVKFLVELLRSAQATQSDPESGNADSRMMELRLLAAKAEEKSGID